MLGSLLILTGEMWFGILVSLIAAVAAGLAANVFVMRCAVTQGLQSSMV